MDTTPDERRISKLAPHPRRHGIVNVYVNGVLAVSVSEAVALRAGLRLGLALRGEDLDRLTGEDEFQLALDRALAFLSFRARSEREVRLRLTRRGCNPEIIDAVVERLTGLGLVDDLAFSRQWISNRDHLKPKGNWALKAELASKGVSKDVVDQAIIEGDDDSTRALNLAQARFPRLKNLDAATFHKRLSAMLLRRGFSYEVAVRTTREIWKQQANARPMDDQA